MKKKYRIKKTAKNIFTALSGKDAFQMFGGSNCLIVKNLTVSGKQNVQRYAYSLYQEETYILNKFIKITCTCGVANCIKKEHLIAEYIPSKEEIEYINTYKDVDGIEVLAHNIKVPVELLTKFLAK